MVTGLSFFTWTMDVPHLPSTLANYEALGRRSLAPVLVSYGSPSTSTAAAVAVGVVAAYVVARRGFRVLGPALNALVMLPYLIPGRCSRWGSSSPSAVRRSPSPAPAFILGLAYFIRKLPYAMKSAEAALYQVHPSLEEAALGVGAPPARAFRDVTARLILPAVVSGSHRHLPGHHHRADARRSCSTRGVDHDDGGHLPGRPGHGRTVRDRRRRPRWS